MCRGRAAGLLVGPSDVAFRFTPRRALALVGVVAVTLPPKAVKQTFARAAELLPPLGRAGIAGAWAGFVDSTPDGVPGIGEVPEVPGLILAAGFSGHGFGIGPGAGHLIADLVTGAPPLFDPAPYDPARFRRSAWGQVADF